MGYCDGHVKPGVVVQGHHHRPSTSQHHAIPWAMGALKARYPGSVRLAGGGGMRPLSRGQGRAGGTGFGISRQGAAGTGLRFGDASPTRPKGDERVQEDPAGSLLVAGACRHGSTLPRHSQVCCMTLAEPPSWRLTCSRAQRAVSTVRGVNSRFERVSLMRVVSQSCLKPSTSSPLG